MLEEFLGIERENPKVKTTICLQTKPKNPKKNQLKDLKIAQVEPYKTGAVAPDVAKRVVGKLPKERIPVVKKEEVRVIPQSFLHFENTQQ